jgi:hypothetical protein
VRVLFTVALTVAVAGVVLPAVDVAALDRAESESRGEVARLGEAGRTLAASNDALATRERAARRILTLEFPSNGFASTPLVAFTVGPPRNGTRSDGEPGAGATRITWRVAGGERHVTQVDGLRMRSVDGGRFRLHEGGRQRLVLTLLDRGGRRVVTVSRQ